MLQERKDWENSETAQRIPTLENEIRQLEQEKQTLTIESRREIEEQKARAELFRQKLSSLQQNAESLATDNSQLQQDVRHQAEALAVRQEHQNTITELEAKLHESDLKQQTKEIELRRDLDEQLATAELLRQKLRAMESKQESLEQEKEQLQKDYLGQAKDVATHQGLQQASEKLRLELEELRSRKEQELSDIRRELDDQNGVKERLEQRLQAAIESAEALQATKAALEQDVLAQAKELAAQSGQQENLESLQQELAQLKEARGQQDQEAIRNKGLLEQQQAQLQIIEQQLQSSQEKVRQLNVDNKTLQEQLDKQDALNEQTQTEQETLAAMQLEMSGRQTDSEVELAALRRELNVETRRAEATQAKLEKQQAELATVQGEREQLHQDLLRQSEALANRMAEEVVAGQLRAEIAALKADFEERQSQASQQLQAIETEKNGLIARLKDELEVVQNQLQEAAAEYASQDASNGDAISELKQKLVGYEDNLAQVRTEKQELAETVETLTEDVAAKAKQALELRETVDSLQDALENATSKAQSIDEFQEREKELREKLSTQTSASDRLQAELDKVSSAHVALQERLTANEEKQAEALQALEQEKQKATELATDAEKNVTELKKKIASLGEEVTKLEAGHQETLDGLKAENEEFKRSVTELHAISNEYEELKLVRKREKQTARERLQEATTANAELSVEVAGLREKLQMLDTKRSKSAKSRRSPKPKTRQLEMNLEAAEDSSDRKRRSTAKSQPARTAERPTKSTTRGRSTSGSATTAAKPRMVKDKNLGMIYAARPNDVDDLKQISGVGPVLERRLHSAGIYRFEQVRNWTTKTITFLDEQLSLGGRIEREDWVSQAKALTRKKTKR